MNSIVLRSIRNAGFATLILLGVYIVIVFLVSGWSFMLQQLSLYWYYTLPLAVGFGIQIGLYTYLKNAIKQKASPHILAVSGTTSTAAMISCCAHYLVNLLPILGTVGIITVISQYQVQFFWIGLVFNFGGILYMLSRVIKYTRGI